jgi:hypothetical protein
MLAGIESHTFKWTVGKSKSDGDYGARLGEFCINENVRGRLRFPSCGLVSFNAALEGLLRAGTRFRRLEGVVSILASNITYVVLDSYLA